MRLTASMTVQKPHSLLPGNMVKIIAKKKKKKKKNPFQPLEVLLRTNR